MKAALALIIIYVGTFLVVIQGASQNSAETQKQDAGQTSRPIDLAKETDIRSLMELLGARELVEDSTKKGVEQYRENLLTSVPDNERGQQFVNAFMDGYQKKFDPDAAKSQYAAIYDKHFTAEEVKGLLEFYGSPLGQKYAQEMPKVTAEIQAATRAASVRVAKEVLQELRAQYPGVSARARLQKRNPQTEQAQSATQPQTRPIASQP